MYKESFITSVFLVIVGLTGCDRQPNPTTQAAPPQAKTESPRVMNLAMGRGWTLADDAGEVTIKVVEQAKRHGQDCYRVDWISKDQNYQSEFWEESEQGILVHGRRVMGVDLEYEQPYFIVKYPIRPGEAWDAELSVKGRHMTVRHKVEEPQELETSLGKLRAYPVVARTGSVVFKRWYVQGVGIVQDESYAVEGERLRPINVKKLAKVIEADHGGG